MVSEMRTSRDATRPLPGSCRSSPRLYNHQDCRVGGTNPTHPAQSEELRRCNATTTHAIDPTLCRRASWRSGAGPGIRISQTMGSVQFHQGSRKVQAMSFVRGVTINGERIASLRPHLNLETREHAGTDPVWRPGLGDLRTPEIVYCSAGQCNTSQVLPQNPRGRVEQGSCGPMCEGDNGEVGYRRSSSTTTC